MESMKIVEKIQAFGYEMRNSSGKSHYFFEKEDKWLCYIAPHEGTEMKHLIRAELASEFERWGHAQVQELFTSEDELALILTETENMVPEDDFMTD